MSSSTNELEDKLLKYLFDTLSTNPTQTINCSVFKKENDKIIEFNMSASFSNPIKSEDLKEAKKINESSSQINFKNSSIDCVITLESKNGCTATMSHTLNMNHMFVSDVSQLSPDLSRAYDFIKSQCFRFSTILNSIDNQDLLNWTIVRSLVTRQWNVDLKLMEFEIIAEDDKKYDIRRFHNFLNTLKVGKINKFKIIVNDEYNN